MVCFLPFHYNRTHYTRQPYWCLVIHRTTVLLSGIQGRACAWVERIDGCYNNVVGFPLHDFACQVSALVKERLL